MNKIATAIGTFFKKTWIFILAVLLTSLVLTSCGPSKEEIEAWETTYTQAEIDSMWKEVGFDGPCTIKSKLESTPDEEAKTISVTETKVGQTYLASDFNLVSGEVIGFTLTSSTLDDAYAKNEQPIFYIKIKQPDGITKSILGNHQIYYTLNPGDILK